MSDLSATACGCNNSCSNNGCGSLITILLLCTMCGGGLGNNGCNDGCNNGGLLGGGDSLCTILCLCLLCGGLGGNNGCGCGC